MHIDVSSSGPPYILIVTVLFVFQCFRVMHIDVSRSHLVIHLTAFCVPMFSCYCRFKWSSQTHNVDIARAVKVACAASCVLQSLLLKIAHE